jgi:kumamolisin
VKNRFYVALLAVATLAVTPLIAQSQRQFHNHIRLSDQDQLIHSLATPAGENPATIACIYGLVSVIAPGCPINGTTAVPTGGRGVIVIVDAYDYPTAANDLKTFSTQFGLPPGKLVKVFASGTKPSSGCSGVGGAGNWGLEESLDIEYAHALAPNAAIILMEAASNSNDDLFAAVQAANNLLTTHHVKGQISMSWGEGEFPGEASNDSNFTANGVTYYASTGDRPGTEYPSVSPNIIAVGGTVIQRSGGNFTKQIAWFDGGGGLSTMEPIPSFQSAIASIVGTKRGVPDVSLIAGTNTAIYNTGGGTCGNGWLTVQGTSIAAPVFAGIVNNAGTGNASSNAENTEIYSNLGDSAVWTDITTGNCGTHAGSAGWDFCTGVGSPVGFIGK